MAKRKEDKMDKLCKIISFINNKGGVGKTTSVVIISELLAFLGANVLVIDLDQQANITMMLNTYEEDSSDVVNGLELPTTPNICELFKKRLKHKEDIETLIQKTSIQNIDIIASSKRHKNTPTDILRNNGNNNIILKKALDIIKMNYDYILIDNAPANDILTVNSIFASDIIFVPVRVESFSYKGLKETIDSISYIQEEHDIKTMVFGGAFITQAETQTVVFKNIEENYKNELKDKFLTTPIRRDVKINEIQTAFLSILEHSPNTNAVFDYANLILEMDILTLEKKLILEKALNII